MYLHGDVDCDLITCHIKGGESVRDVKSKSITK